MFEFDQAFRDEFRQNWAILVIAFAALFFGFSAPAYALPFIYPEVIAEFGWTREQATLLASAKYLTGAVACLVVGRLLDVTGAWVALMLSIVIGGVALIGFTLVDGLTSYYIIGVMLGIAGPGAMVSVFVLVARTFKASQGTATGIALLGTAIGGVVMPVVTAALIARYGWRDGMALLSVGIWAVALPMLIYGMRRMPLPHEERPAEPSAPQSGVFSYFGRLMAGANFWLMALAFFLVTIVDQAFTQHQVLMLRDIGLSPERGAMIVSLIGVVAIFGRIVAGNILDRSSTRGLALLYLMLTICAVLALFLANPVILIAYVVLRALGHSSVMVDGPVIARQTYGTAHLGLLLGLFTAMANLGSATGPWLMGRLFDVGGSYRLALMVFMALPLVSAILIALVRPHEWRRLRASRAAGDAAAGASTAPAR